VASAWVALPNLGLLATTGPDGRFLFNRVSAGRHKLVVRAPDGGEAKADVDIPGTRADLVIGARAKAK
jgi:hypothetical protein